MTQEDGEDKWIQDTHNQLITSNTFTDSNIITTRDNLMTSNGLIDSNKLIYSDSSTNLCTKCKSKRKCTYLCVLAHVTYASILIYLLIQVTDLKNKIDLIKNQPRNLNEIESLRKLREVLEGVNTSVVNNSIEIDAYPKFQAVCMDL